MIESKVAQNAGSNGNDSQHRQPTYNNDDPAYHAAAGIYYDYKRGSMVELEDSGAQAASMSAAAGASWARSKTETVEMEEEVKGADIRDMASVLNEIERQSGGRRKDEI